MSFGKTLLHALGNLIPPNNIVQEPQLAGILYVHFGMNPIEKYLNFTNTLEIESHKRQTNTMQSPYNFYSTTVHSYVWYIFASMFYLWREVDQVLSYYAKP